MLKNVAFGMRFLIAIGTGCMLTACSAPGPKPMRVIERASCSSLTQAKQPLDVALQTIAGIGYKYVDLSALFWAPHVSPAELVKDFDKEATRVESALAAHGLKVSNLTFDPIEQRPFETYQQEFEALAKFAGRNRIRLINLMAPGVKFDRAAAVEKLRTLVAIGRRHGVLVSVETHCNQITERPADARWLCEQVPGLGLTLDPSHYYAGVNQGASFDELYPLVYGTGFRAGGMIWEEIQLPWGSGPIDFRAVVARLEQAGYKGFYVSEYIEGFNKVDAVTEARRYLEWARQLQ